MNLYAVWMGYGMFVVRAEDEDDARRVAYEGDQVGGEAASEYGVDLDMDAAVELLAGNGDPGVLASHYG